MAKKRRKNERRENKLAKRALLNGIKSVVESAEIERAVRASEREAINFSYGTGASTFGRPRSTVSLIISDSFLFHLASSVS